MPNDVDLRPGLAEASRLSRRRFLSLAGASMVVAGAGVFTMTTARAGTGFKLGVLHINDLHSRIESIGRSDATCSPQDAAEERCFGGYARLATKIRERREALSADGVPVVTLDAGDQFQGSLYYTTYKGMAEVEFMNAIGFDAMALGNHEFDDGPGVLAEFIRAASFPVVSGNTKVADVEPLSEVLREHVILEVGDEKVAVLSVLTPNTTIIASPGPNVTFEDEIVYLQEAVARVKGEGVHKILVLSHVGFLRDQEIAGAVDGISAIIGGHSHTLLSNSVDGAPPYATLIESPSGRAVPIVQAYAFSRFLGDLMLEMDEEGAVVSATGDTILLDASVEPDPIIEARIQELAGPIEEIKRRPVATLSAPIDGSRESCRARECEMGNTVTDAMLARVAEQGVTIAITNGGGLRAGLVEGVATMGDVLTVLPFQNTLATLELTGADIVAALEHGVGAVEEGAGRFPQVAGLRFRLDLTKPAGEGRVSDVEVRTGDGFAPIDMEETYTIVTNNFMANGGDGYAVFRDNGRNPYVTATGLDEALATFLAANEPFAPTLEGRIVQ